MANTPYIDLVKPAGTDKALISVINANSDKIDSAVGGVQDALAIVCNGNTHGAITSGQYVYVRAHETLQEGLYTANSNIAANAALSSSNLTANSSGGLNALSEQIGTLNGKIDDKLPGNSKIISSALNSNESVTILFETSVVAYIFRKGYGRCNLLVDQFNGIYEVYNDALVTSSCSNKILTITNGNSVYLNYMIIIK